MKHILLSLIFLSAVAFVQAQEVSEAARPFLKKEQANSLSIVLQGQPKNVKAVLEKKMREKAGQLTKGRAGLRLVEGARYDEISATALDMYYRVEKASKRDNTHSRVTLFLSTGNGNFVSSEEFPDEIAAATNMLENLELEVKVYEMKLLIKEQEKLITKEEKNFNRMVQDSISLQQQLAEVKNNIVENHEDRIDQTQKVENEKVRLEEFKEQLMELEAMEAQVLRVTKKEEDEFEDER